MRQRDFDYSGGERRDERAYGGDRGRERPSRGEETWYREGRSELPADQDIEWYRRAASERQSEDGPFAGRGPRGYRRSDQSIFEEVCERLTAHGYIDATDLDVEVRQGVVTLTGSAPDRRQKRLAEETIENVAGVQDVQNELRLAGRGAAEGAADDTKREPTTRGEREPTTRGERDGAMRGEREFEQSMAFAQTARKDEAVSARDESPARERLQPVESAGGSSFDRSQDRPVDQDRLTGEERKADEGFPRREERQPVGVMGRDGDRQPEMTTPRSAAATDQPAAKTPQRAGETSDTRMDRIAATPTSATTGASGNAMAGASAGAVGGAPRTEAVGSADIASGRAGQSSADRVEDRISDRDMDETRVQPATREVRLQAGAPVYSREGEKIGEVAEGSGDSFVVHKGLIFASELYFPAASILRSDENGVQLNVSKDDVANYKDRPAATRAG